MSMAVATALALAPNPPIGAEPRRTLLLRHRGCRAFEPLARRKSRGRMRLPPLSCAAEAPAAEGQEEEPYSVLASLSSQYNDIVVVDTPTSRVLLLDSTHNIHSMLGKEQIWTGSFWDEFASLPAIVPQGPIAIFGLGAGTAAHLLLKLWPSLHLVGWEIDEILIDMAREYFGLSDLEKCTQAGGSLTVHIGDALAPSVSVEGGFAGIIVDLFSEGEVLPQLKEVETWLEIEKKLMPHGRIMVNTGGAHAEVFGTGDSKVKTGVPLAGPWLQNSTIKALCQAFPGKLSWKKMPEEDSDNYLALTGPQPNLDVWSAALPSPLSLNVRQWTPCELA